MSSWHDYEWQLLGGPAESPAMHMALDEVLTREVGAARRSPTLRFWNWTARAVVLGSFQSVRNEVDPEGAKRHGMTVVRRITGGGAMFIEPESAITYSLYAPVDLVAGLSFVESYAFLDAWVIDALKSLGVDAFYRPINDISSTRGKIGGAAQTRRGGAVLHHATLAYDMDTRMMLEVLRIGKEKLSDKGTSSAAKRVSPLREQTELPRQTIIDRFIETFRDCYGLSPTTLSASEREEAERLVAGKFATHAWTHHLP